MLHCIAHEQQTPSRDADSVAAARAALFEEAKQSASAAASAAASASASAATELDAESAPLLHSQNGNGRHHEQPLSPSPAAAESKQSSSSDAGKGEKAEDEITRVCKEADANKEAKKFTENVELLSHVLTRHPQNVEVG